MANFAYIQDDKIVSIIEASSIDDLLPLDKKFQNIVDLSSYSPEPKVGWSFIDNKFINPADNTSPETLISMKITKLGMLQRFTLAERLAILNYVQQNPVSVPAVLLQNIQVATFVDLKRADTQAGIAYLQQLGLLTSDRVTAILTTLPSDLEAYKG